MGNWIFYHTINKSEQVTTRRSIVLSIPLLLLYPETSTNKGAKILTDPGFLIGGDWDKRTVIIELRRQDGGEACVHPVIELRPRL